MTDTPIWMLDVDGVLNGSRAGWHRAPHKGTAGGFTIRWEPQLITRIWQLHDSGAVEVRWSSTWCGDEVGLAQLERLLGIELPRAFGRRPMSKTWGEMKADAAVGVLAEERRLIWTDDMEVGAGRRLYPEIAAGEEAGRALLIEPNATRGLRPEDMDRIEAFAAGNLKAAA